MREARIELTFSPQEVEEIIINAARAHLGAALVNGNEFGGMSGIFGLNPHRIYGDITVVFIATQEGSDE